MECIDKIEFALNHPSATMTDAHREALETALKWIKEDVEVIKIQNPMIKDYIECGEIENEILDETPYIILYLAGRNRTILRVEHEKNKDYFIEFGRAEPMKKLVALKKAHEWIKENMCRQCGFCTCSDIDNGECEVDGKQIDEEHFCHNGEFEAVTF